MTDKQQSPNFTQDQTSIFTEEPGPADVPRPSPTGPPDLVARLGRNVAQRLYDSWAEDLARVGDAYLCGRIDAEVLLVGVAVAYAELAQYRPDGPMAARLARYPGFGAVDDPPAGAVGASKQDLSAPESGSGTEVAISNSKSKRIRKSRK